VSLYFIDYTIFRQKSQ